MTHPKASARKRGERLEAPGVPGSEAPRTGAKHLPTARAQAPEAGSPPGMATFEGQYRVDLPDAGFEGPLDLLLHLIQQHELDILDIPISFVTEKFLQYLSVMRTLTIDVASEYLVMAATLAHIKSKMLLPTVPEGQEDAADVPEAVLVEPPVALLLSDPHALSAREAATATPATAPYR